MELIRPLYCINEDDIIEWKKANDLKFINCACRFTEMCTLESGNEQSARAQTKKLIKSLKDKIPDVEHHIFKSIHNVNIDTFVGMKKDGKYFDFKQMYDENE